MREARRPQRLDLVRRRIAANERSAAQRLTVRLTSSGMIAVGQLAPSASSAGRGRAAHLSGRLVSCRVQFFRRPPSRRPMINRSAARPTPPPQEPRFCEAV